MSNFIVRSVTGVLARVGRTADAAFRHTGKMTLLALGVARGPDVARVLGALRDARLDGEIRDRQGEIDYVKSWLEHHMKKEG